MHIDLEDPAEIARARDAVKAILTARLRTGGTAAVGDPYRVMLEEELQRVVEPIRDLDEAVIAEVGKQVGTLLAAGALLSMTVLYAWANEATGFPDDSAEVQSRAEEMLQRTYRILDVELPGL